MKQRLFNLPLMMLGTAPILTGFFLFIFSLAVFSTTILSLTEDALAENVLVKDALAENTLAKNALSDTIGKVVALRGKAQAIQSDLKSRPLALKSPVFLQDTIKTTQGRIQLMFKDNTLITLGRNTEMVINEYQWKSGDPDSGIITQIKAGSFRIMGGAITRDAPQNFKTQAPAATIGIRGSMYAGIVRDKSLSVVFQGGKSIYVVNSMGRVEIDRPGYGTIVRDGSHPPEKPEKMDEKVLQDIEGELATSTEETGTGETDTEKTENQNETQEAKQDDTDPEGNSEDQLADNSTETTDTATPPPENTVADIKDTLIQDPNSPVNTPPPLPPISPISEEEKNILALLKEMGFTGDRAAAIPSTGLWSYGGELKDQNDSTIQDNITVFINWDNQRFLALEETHLNPDKTPHGFAFGQVTDSGEIVAVQVLGTENFNNSGQIETITGHETFGHIYGTAQEAAGMALEGVDINVQDQTIQRAWSDTLAVTVDTKVANVNPGSVTWNGFFMGVGEDMNAPDIDRVAFVNNDSADFKTTIDKDSGTLTGTLSGYDFLQPSNQITMTIGGDKNKSVYISDDKIAAVLGGTSVVSNPSGNTTLKAHGNFMISSMETPLSDNTNWGYWEVAYEEPGTAKDYHVHVPGAFWVAGEQTSASMVSKIISDSVSTHFKGNYTNGKARGVKFDHNGQMTPLTNGQTNLFIDFDSGVSLPVTGNISFTEINLPVTSLPGDVTSQGFKGTVSGADTGSRVNGTYFGNTVKDGVQGANGIGGNFSATFSGTTTYQGVFAGDR